jgi:hypothetical protein
MSFLNAEQIGVWQARLDAHPIYARVQTRADLSLFMQHHIWSVWDFMSLIKYLQHAVAPARWPWGPSANADVQRFINALVLEEETDAAPPQLGCEFSSHFGLYLGAMREIGADTQPIEQFVAIAVEQGIDAALNSDFAPEPSRIFTASTFAFIDSGRPHEVAAALALGREYIIPTMFRALLARMRISGQDAPIFHFYLNRHIHLDEDFHAPLSLRLLDSLCGDDAQKIAEATGAAEAAIVARERFWDGVLAALN